MDNWQRILQVARRELRIIRNRPLYFMGSVGVIVFCAIFFLTFFKGGLPTDIPIGVVDEDDSSTPRNFCQQLDATQLGKVVQYDFLRRCKGRHDQREDFGGVRHTGRDE